MQKSSLFVVVLAFLQRAFARSVGLYKDPTLGKKLESRAARYLSTLGEPPSSLRFKIALVNLRMDSDLLDEEAALLPEPLYLQLKVVELAEAEESALELTRTMLNEPPLAKLFVAILASAQEDEASGVRIDFSTAGTPIRVSLERGGTWREVMTVPATLSKPLKGFAVRASRVDYRKMRGHLVSPKPMPDDVTYAWESDERLSMKLSQL